MCTADSRRKSNQAAVSAHIEKDAGPTLATRLDWAVGELGLRREDWWQLRIELPDLQLVIDAIDEALERACKVHRKLEAQQSAVGDPDHDQAHSQPGGQTDDQSHD